MNLVLRAILVVAACLVSVTHVVEQATSAAAAPSAGVSASTGPDAGVGRSAGAAGAAATPGPWLVYTKVALTGGHPGDQGVWEMREDGADAHQLFAFADPGAAALSPDGTEVALTHAGGDTVSVLSLSGAIVQTFVVPDPSGRGVVSLRWSPRSDQLAYCVIGATGRLVGYTVGTGGHDATSFGSPGGNPSWAPSGSAMVVDDVGWYSGSTSGGLFVVAPGQPGARPIVFESGSPGAPSQPAWSPSGAQIAFAGLSGLEIVGATGGPVTRLGVDGGAPVWTPDSTTLAYSAPLNGATVSIFTIGADGSANRDVDPSNGDYEDTPIGFVPMPASSTATCGQRLAGGAVAMAATASGDGYVVADRHGDVVACGDAHFSGSLAGVALAGPVTDIVTDRGSGGYWLLGADGGVFAFDAPFLGSASPLRLRAPTVALVATGDDAGYWLVAADGGVFAYGDARFEGSTAAVPLRAAVVGGAADGSGLGYRLVAADGGVFSFGAAFAGSMAGRLGATTVVAVAASASGGYRLVASDGGVFAFGAAFHGSAARFGLVQPIVAAAADPRTDGYWLLGADGGVFAFDAPFCGSAAGR